MEPGWLRVVFNTPVWWRVWSHKKKKTLETGNANVQPRLSVTKTSRGGMKWVKRRRREAAGGHHIHRSVAPLELAAPDEGANKSSPWQSVVLRKIICSFVIAERRLIDIPSSEKWADGQYLPLQTFSTRLHYILFYFIYLYNTYIL